MCIATALFVLTLVQDAVDFPSVTVCNKNRVNCGRLVELVRRCEAEPGRPCSLPVLRRMSEVCNAMYWYSWDCTLIYPPQVGLCSLDEGGMKERANMTEKKAGPGGTAAVIEEMRKLDKKDKDSPVILSVS